jgi:hypothetical protein
MSRWASAASLVTMAVSLPAFFSRWANWASSTASADPAGRGKVKRLPEIRLGSCMVAMANDDEKSKTPPAKMEGGDRIV